MPSENRPAPAVGQVWRDEDGMMFVVCNGVEVSVFYEDLGAAWNIPTHRAVEPTDTYVGQFRGFKVEGDE